MCCTNQAIESDCSQKFISNRKLCAFLGFAFQTIPPYEPLIFPLPGDTVEQMIQSMPTSYKDIINSCIDQVSGDKTTVPQSTAESIINATPTPTTTLASNCKNRFTTQQYSDLSMLVEDSDETESIQEDANDPEWNFEPPTRIQKTQ